MLKLRNILLYTGAIFMIYIFSMASYLGKDSFSPNEVPTIINVIVVVVYFVGLLFFVFRKPNDTKSDNRLIKRLEMKVPKMDTWDSIKGNTKNIYIRCWNINPYQQKFFISDLEGNLLYKVKQQYGYIPATYTVFDPYDRIIGSIKNRLIQFTPTFKIVINNQQEFEIKKTIEAMSDNYKFETIPLSIKGDFYGFNYTVISKDDNSIIAKIDTITIDGTDKLGNADIIIYNNKYSLEIICSVICSILVKIKINEIGNE